MNKLQQTMRWFGPEDPVSLADIRQAGASGVVTALHHLPNGAIWPLADIEARQAEIREAGLEWTVVESIPVHEDIKLRQNNFADYLANYKTSLENLAAAGIRTVCYNFMPVLDWTRTDLEYRLPSGARALRFEHKALAAFDLLILKRPNAESDYAATVLEEAAAYYQQLTAEAKEKLIRTVTAGLPGAEESYSLDDFNRQLAQYSGVNRETLERNLDLFLSEILPVAEACGVLMALHPDDPPFPLFGLPRVVSTAADLRRILKSNPSRNNGFTFCTGSYGVRADNNLPEMIREFQDRIYFIHLRSTKRDERGNFYEAEHLDGDVPIYEVVKSLMHIEVKEGLQIPMRPDHGHQILDDLKKQSNPGYTAIGRLKGLAEIRGLMHAISSASS